MAHRGPHVGVDDVGARDGARRVVHNDPRAADAALRHPLDQLRVRLEAARAGAHEVEGDDAGELEPGVDDVVAVSDVHHLLPLDGAVRHDLLDRERVGDDLARVVVVRQPVDDGNL